VKKAGNTENVLTTTATVEQQPVSEEEPQTTITKQIVSIFKTINKALTTVWQ